MKRGIIIFFMTAVATLNTFAATPRGVSTVGRSGTVTVAEQTTNPASSYTYNYMYPYLNNQMRTTLRPADPTSPSTSPINAIVRTEQLSEPRRVVARSAKKTSAPTATPPTNSNNIITPPARRVVARSAVRNTARAPRTVASRSQSTTSSDGSSRLESTYLYRSSTDTPTNTTSIPSSRCLADYTECMNRYCLREDTAYNRCYCSAKLSQIDANYQPTIDSLIKQILELQNNGSWSATEMNEYWESRISIYTGDNSWKNLDNLLDIDWASMESRVRGQNAFATGHEYCVQHLQGCFYMASNLRDAYRSQINTDCASYEKSLQRLKNAAESILQAYQE